MDITTLRNLMALETYVRTRYNILSRASTGQTEMFKYAKISGLIALFQPLLFLNSKKLFDVHQSNNRETAVHTLMRRTIEQDKGILPEQAGIAYFHELDIENLSGCNETNALEYMFKRAANSSDETFYKSLVDVREIFRPALPKNVEDGSLLIGLNPDTKTLVYIQIQSKNAIYILKPVINIYEDDRDPLQNITGNNRLKLSLWLNLLVATQYVYVGLFKDLFDEKTIDFTEELYQYMCANAMDKSVWYTHPALNSIKQKASELNLITSEPIEAVAKRLADNYSSMRFQAINLDIQSLQKSLESKLRDAMRYQYSIQEKRMSQLALEEQCKALQNSLQGILTFPTVENITINGNYVQFFFRTTLQVEQELISKNFFGQNRTYLFFKDLVEKKFSVPVVTAITVAVAATPDSAPDNVINSAQNPSKSILPAIQNPHHYFASCLGGNRVELFKHYINNDFMSFVIQGSYAASLLNVADGYICRRFDETYLDMRNGFSPAEQLPIILPDGTLSTYVEYLKGQKNEKDKTNP